MADFRRRIGALRDDYVRVGFEAELDVDGCLTLREDDRRWADIVLGAVHWLHRSTSSLTEAEHKAEFMRVTTALLERDVDVLAHPMRRFDQRRIDATDLFRDVAQVLAATNTAAEINCHNVLPDPEFFRICLDHGVKLTLGSDTHRYYEAGLFGRHLEILRQVAGDGWRAVLYTPKPSVPA